MDLGGLCMKCGSWWTAAMSSATKISNVTMMMVMMSTMLIATPFWILPNKDPGVLSLKLESRKFRDFGDSLPNDKP